MDMGVAKCPPQHLNKQRECNDRQSYRLTRRSFLPSILFISSSVSGSLRNNVRSLGGCRFWLTASFFLAVSRCFCLARPFFSKLVLTDATFALAESLSSSSLSSSGMLWYTVREQIQLILELLTDKGGISARS